MAPFAQAALSCHSEAPFAALKGKLRDEESVALRFVEEETDSSLRSD